MAKSPLTDMLTRMARANTHIEGEDEVRITAQAMAVFYKELTKKGVSNEIAARFTEHLMTLSAVKTEDMKAALTVEAEEAQRHV